MIMNYRKSAVLFLFAGLALASCKKDEVAKEVEGFKPIYTDAAALQQVDVLPAKALTKPGRIYVYENYLLINEQGEGVHIYDNSNTAQPVALSFVSIPGNMDFSVRNGFMYADNVYDMVVIDITNAASPAYSSRLESVFPAQDFPDEFGPFECVDSNKGIVVGWERTMLTNPSCSR